MKLVIVGGVAGGASAAARARRIDESAHIVLFERGEHISFANCGLPYHIGGVIKDRAALLVQTAAGFRGRYDVDVRTQTEVTRIDRERKTVAWRNTATGQTGEETYDKLILAPGAAPARPPFPGADLDRVFTLRNIADMDRIRDFIDRRKPSRAVVIGGGYIGLEMVENLVHRGVGVTLIELLPQVLSVADPEMAVPVQQILKAHGVELRLGKQLTGVEAVGEGLVAHLSDGSDAPCDFVALSIGVKPEVSLAKDAGLSLGERGGIAVDSHMRTSDPAIFAVGDAVETRDLVTAARAVIPLAGPANRQGRIAADNALGRDSEYRSTQGTAIVRVFDVALAMTGATEKGLKRAGVAYQKCYVHPMQHASYYPGASPITLKLLFSAPEGRILGACAVGVDGVDKRIDVIATAQRAGLTVFDLEHLELCYSPQFGSAKDPVNMAGFVASNMLRGDAPTIHVPDLDEFDREKMVLLDVRKPDENQAGSIPGSTLIPLDELRKRKCELPKGKRIVAYCQVGLRGYIAVRQLAQSGYDAMNLSGGYKTYCQFHPAPAGPCAKSAPAPAAAARTPVSEENPDGAKPAPVAAEVDARGLQCPGPIQRIKETVDRIDPGQTLRVVASDPAFLADLPAWCTSTGNHLVSLEAKDGAFVGVVRKPTPAERMESLAARGSVAAGAASKNTTIVVFSGDLDKALAAFVIANGSAAMGGRVTMFFTFWGLNALRRDKPAKVEKSMIDRMFGWMMPRGARKLRLSKMNMAGLGTKMMRSVMSKKNVPSLCDMMESARKSGVKLVACSMSMDVMGLKREELLEGVEVGGVASYLSEASQGGVNLFI